ncbi:hypothetical protein [Ruminiclostridium josui]|uniref:Dph6-related ATP pyrophosphatase n=1 Tax=Ruminiclostridium josui TaxID=1499 RepID=UPI0004675CFD|nr:hypothetical protein [Ruminiclostridium josui]
MNIQNDENYWPVPAEELRNIPEGEPFICMFSGGKDCGLALSVALDKGKLFEIVHCLHKETEKSIWHSQSRQIVEKQAVEIKKNVNFSYSSVWYHRTKYIHMLMDYAKKGVKSVVFGDLFEEKQAKLEVALCKCAGLIPRMPLWQIPEETLIQEVQKRKIKSIITLIRSPKIPLEWLGKQFDEEAYKYFIKLGIDPFGENGEFHTSLVGADYFEKDLSYSLGEVVRDPEGMKIELLF